MAEHLGDVMVPERAINISIEGDEDVSVLPVDARVLKQLLTTSGSRRANSFLSGEDRHPPAQNGPDGAAI